MMPARVLVRVVKSPQIARGEVLAVYVDSRRLDDPAVVVYSITRDQWIVERHRQLMWRTKRASPTEIAEARTALQNIGEDVTILQAAPRATLGADELPAPS